MKRPVESEYTSQVAYTRALEAYCDSLAPLPEQEPFGYWHWEQPMTKPLQGWFVKGPSDGKLNGVAGIALYTAPLLPVQEPWMYRLWNDKDAQWQLTDDCSWPAEPIYTTPPKRPWVGLTDEEIDSWFLGNTALKMESGRKIAQAIEAKLKELNT